MTHPLLNYASFLVEIFEIFYAIDCVIMFYVMMQSIAHNYSFFFAYILSPYIYNE